MTMVSASDSYIDMSNNDIGSAHNLYIDMSNNGIGSAHSSYIDMSNYDNGVCQRFIHRYVK